MGAIDLMDLAKLLVTLIDVEAMRAENEVSARDKATAQGGAAFRARREYAAQVLQHIEYRERQETP